MAVGFRFSEKMAGPCALGADEPKQGKRQGRREGSELAMRVTVHLDDVEAFCGDAEHRGRLSGWVDFTPWGDDLPVVDGKVHLMRPADASDSTDDHLKHMIYQVVVEAEGEPWCVAGKKMIRDDAGLDLWGDTTTLYTCIYRGREPEGEVVGAGVLTLGVGELVKLVASMRPVGAEDAAEAAKAAARFGEFFFGELWKTYGIHFRTSR